MPNFALTNVLGLYLFYHTNEINFSASIITVMVM